MKNQLSTSCTIDAPIALVFERASDFANAGDRISAITEVEILAGGDPVGVGTRFKETRIMFGREASETMEVTLFEPPHRYVLEAESHGSHYRSEIVCEEVEGGTEITMNFRGTPKSFLAKVMSILMRPMMKKLADACAKDLEDLKASIEGEVASG